MAKKPSPAPPAPSFTPVKVRHRHDGWTPERQLAFVDALAQSGCVTEAAGSVGMSVNSAYLLRQRWDGAAFAYAWEAALAQAVNRLTDAVMSRAIHGVATPVFYKGEQIGERRKFDEGLAQFLLRHRSPEHYSGWSHKKQVDRPDTYDDWFDEARCNLFDEIDQPTDAEDDSKGDGS